MAKGYISSGDPERQTVFDSLPDGNYVVNGIDSFIPAGDPVFVPMNNTLVVKFKFSTVTGEEGPAASCTAPEFWMLINALGGDTSVATPKQRTSTDALIRAVNTLSGKKTLTVEASNGGWANKLRYQLYPPEGKYKIVMTKAYRPDREENNLTFQKGFNTFTKKEEEQLVLEFEIAGNSQGKPTLYDGYALKQYITNPFVAEATTIDGVHITAKEKGCPLFGHTPNGGEVNGTYQWKVFWQYFAPAALEHDWQTDELDQPQILIIKEALKAQVPVTIFWQKKEKSPKGAYGFTWKDVAKLNDIPEVEEETEEETTQLAQLSDLISYIETKWNKDIFEVTTNDSVIFSEQGKAWATQFLSPAWVKAGMSLEDRKALHLLSAEEVDHLLKAFKQIHGEVGVSSGW